MRGVGREIQHIETRVSHWQSLTAPPSVHPLDDHLEQSREGGSEGGRGKGNSGREGTLKVGNGKSSSSLLQSASWESALSYTQCHNVYSRVCLDHLVHKMNREGRAEGLTFYNDSAIAFPCPCTITAIY